MQVDTTFEIPVHAEAELGEIEAILRPWEKSGELPSGSLAALAETLASLRGGRLVVWEVFPQLFKDQAKTREELVTAQLLNLTP